MKYKLKQREMVLIPIPFSDLKSKKRRPVIVISNNIYNQKTDLGISEIVPFLQYWVMWFLP